jgi:hypothetical protein
MLSRKARKKREDSNVKDDLEREKVTKRRQSIKDYVARSSFSVRA